LRLVNDAARDLFDLRFDPRGAVLEEAVRHPTVVRDVGVALLGGTPDPSLVRLAGSDRAFELRVVSVDGTGRPGTGGALLLLFDVTRLEALERLRQEFVADVSHELRTPLTSIRASVENLLESGIEDRAHARNFLEIVRRHAERMGALIEDLTDLSLIETGAVHLELRAVDAAEVVREILDTLAPLAARRNVRLRSELPAPFPVHADRRRLEQMLGNLVDNAIKFNRDGGTVVVGGRRAEEATTLIVEDTGQGIAADRLDRVFQRFYQVERARSRALGGTGLGLAIVKHLMRLHGGRVRVESELGAGSRFFLEFPGSPAALERESAVARDSA
jgi:two-component system phosphate regulon sensor histidine kinase PhoR